MKKFINHSGIIAPLNRSNIDTDIIIPKQFLKNNTNVGFGRNLFHNWRYVDGFEGKQNRNFVLNKPNYVHSSVLLTRENFGCGSSREHAVWALIDYGFKVIIAPSFSDIFYNNAVNNRLLLIIFSQDIIDELFMLTRKYVNLHANISLIDKKLIVMKRDYFFKINSFYRFCLLNGLDSIDYTLRFENKIKNYECSIPSFFMYTKNKLS